MQKNSLNFKIKCVCHDLNFLRIWGRSFGQMLQILGSNNYKLVATKLLQDPEFECYNKKSSFATLYAA